MHFDNDGNFGNNLDNKFWVILGVFLLVRPENG